MPAQESITVGQIGAVLDAILAKQTVMLWGASGDTLGEALQQFANDRNLKLSVVKLSTVDLTDLEGIDGFPAAFVPTEPNSILFLDEITFNRPGTQALAYRIIVNRAVGSQPLPEDCRVICAGDRDLACTVPSVLANKFFHILVKN